MSTAWASPPTRSINPVAGPRFVVFKPRLGSPLKPLLPVTEARCEVQHLDVSLLPMYSNSDPSPADDSMRGAPEPTPIEKSGAKDTYASALRRQPRSMEVPHVE
jgi:hypothetical protein